MENNKVKRETNDKNETHEVNLRKTLIKVNYVGSNLNIERSTDCMFLNPKTIVYIRKPSEDEIDHCRFNGINIPKCLVGTVDGKEIKSYNIDLDTFNNILTDNIND